LTNSLKSIQQQSLEISRLVYIRKTF